jgi:hypothetical protein
MVSWIYFVKQSSEYQLKCKQRKHGLLSIGELVIAELMIVQGLLRWRHCPSQEVASKEALTR